MTILEQIEQHMLANLDGSMDFIHLSLRIPQGSAHCSLRRAPSVAEATTYFERDGREFRPPTLVAARAEADGTVREQRPVVRNAPIRSDETLTGVGDEAFLWRGYTNNQRGVIKFRSGRFIGEVNAPSVEDAKILATRLADLAQ